MVSFQRGDQVQLRSGGASMLVTNDNADGTVICFWFSNEEDQLVWRSFENTALQLVQPQAPAAAVNAGSARRPPPHIRAVRR